MNGLETGFYLLVSIATVAVNFVEANPGRLPQMLALGVMLGLCFLSRNDAAFLIAAILLARFVPLWPSSATGSSKPLFRPSSASRWRCSG
jgi:hypothetical protein